MPQYSVVLELPDGGRAMVCGNKPMKACVICRAAVSAFLCDWQVGDLSTEIAGGGFVTCDAPICDECKVSKGPNVDWCPTHESE